MSTRTRALGVAAATALTLGLASTLVALPSSPSGAQTQATVQVVHGIPSVGAVDVCANRTIELLSDVPFGAVATLEVAAGTYDLTVHAASPGTCDGAELIALDGAEVPAGANVSVVANLTGGSPNLAVYPNDVSAVPAGGGRVAVYHAADAPTVDVLVNGGAGIDDLAQRQVRAADLPAGSYDFTVTSADGSVTVATLAGVQLAEGQLLQVFAVGALPDGSGSNPFQAVVNVIDLPIAGSGSLPATPGPDAGPNVLGETPTAGSQAHTAQPRVTG
jgi:hypothetical protein